MPNEFNIPALFNRAFNFDRGVEYTVEEDGEASSLPNFPDVPEVNEDEGTEFINMRDTLGRRTPLGQLLFMPVRLGGVDLPNEPTLLINTTKIIKKTQLAGSSRRGTVKELISNGDWSITIRGLAINYASTKVYPEDQVKALRDLLGRNESLAVESALTNLFGIYRLVIESATFPEMIGIQHAQAYEFRCFSDEDFLLEIE